MVKTIFKFIKEDILQIKTVFKVKIEESWFSKEYYYVKFSENNGWTWKYLLKSIRIAFSSFSGEEALEKLTVNRNDVVGFAEQFKTIDDCLKYNQKVINKIRKHNTICKEEFQQTTNNIREEIRKFNSKS
jgi:hypothetical protein